MFITVVSAEIAVTYAVLRIVHVSQRVLLRV